MTSAEPKDTGVRCRAVPRASPHSFRRFCALAAHALAPSPVPHTPGTPPPPLASPPSRPAPHSCARAEWPWKGSSRASGTGVTGVPSKTKRRVHAPLDRAGVSLFSHGDETCKERSERGAARWKRSGTRAIAPRVRRTPRSATIARDPKVNAFLRLWRALGPARGLVSAAAAHLGNQPPREGACADAGSEKRERAVAPHEMQRKSPGVGKRVLRTDRNRQRTLDETPRRERQVGVPGSGRPPRGPRLLARDRCGRPRRDRDAGDASRPHCHPTPVQRIHPRTFDRDSTGAPPFLSGLWSGATRPEAGPGRLERRDASPGVAGRKRAENEGPRGPASQRSGGRRTDFSRPPPRIDPGAIQCRMSPSDASGHAGGVPAPGEPGGGGRGRGRGAVGEETRGMGEVAVPVPHPRSTSSILAFSGFSPLHPAARPTRAECGFSSSPWRRFCLARCVHRHRAEKCLRVLRRRSSVRKGLAAPRKVRGSAGRGPGEGVRGAEGGRRRGSGRGQRGGGGRFARRVFLLSYFSLFFLPFFSSSFSRRGLVAFNPRRLVSVLISLFVPRPLLSQVIAFLSSPRRVPSPFRSSAPHRRLRRALLRAFRLLRLFFAASAGLRLPRGFSKGSSCGHRFRCRCPPPPRPPFPPSRWALLRLFRGCPWTIFRRRRLRRRRTILRSQ